MNCPECQERLRIRHVYIVNDKKTQDAECVPCDKRFTLMTQIVCEARNRGDGAATLAKKIARGEVTS